MNVLAGKGKLSNRFNDHVCAAGRGIANGDTRRQQCEIDELAAIHRKILYLRLFNHRIGRGACWLDQRSFRGHRKLLLHLAGNEGEIHGRTFTDA